MGEGQQTYGDIIILNKALTQNVETSQALPKFTLAVSVQSRGQGAIQWSLTSGDSNSLYQTIKAGNEMYIDRVYWNDVTLYMYTTAAGETAEIVCFVGAK